jgi:hypothetical protein
LITRYENTLGSGVHQSLLSSRDERVSSRKGADSRQRMILRRSLKDFTQKKTTSVNDLVEECAKKRIFNSFWSFAIKYKSPADVNCTPFGRRKIKTFRVIIVRDDSYIQ